MPRPILGVTRSVLGRTWIERCDPTRATIALAIAQTHGLPEILGRVLAGRGVTVQETEGFLNPRLRDLMPDPHRLTDMQEAARRLADAIERRERVAIFGDYDVDGACSAALLGEYLRGCGTPFVIHIPDRITEGYGPNIEAIRALKEDGACLLVTVDCGTASHEPLAEAARLSLDAVVLDHHQAPERFPRLARSSTRTVRTTFQASGIFARQASSSSRSSHSIAILRQRGFFAGRAEPDLIASLDLVALATVADVVPLTGLNRAFVRQGLIIMRRRSRIGLAALADAAGLSGAPESFHLGYLVGPRINAGGRIGDAALGARLLLSEDPVEAGLLATELDRLNRERQAIEQVALLDAEAQALHTLDLTPDASVIVVAARRLASRHRRPHRRPPQGAVPPSRLCVQSECRGNRRPAPAARSLARIWDAPSGPRWNRGWRSRAAGMRWRQG